MSGITYPNFNFFLASGFTSLFNTLKQIDDRVTLLTTESNDDVTPSINVVRDTLAVDQHKSEEERMAELNKSISNMRNNVIAITRDTSSLRAFVAQDFKSVQEGVDDAVYVAGQLDWSEHEIVQLHGLTQDIADDIAFQEDEMEGLNFKEVIRDMKHTLHEFSSRLHAYEERTLWTDQSIDSQAARLAKYQDAADALTQQIDSLEMKTDGLDQLVKEDDVIGKNAEEVSSIIQARKERVMRRVLLMNKVLASLRL